MTTLSFKVSEDEAREIRRQAKLAGVTVSEFLRRRAMGNEPGEVVEKIRCEFTGAEIFAPLAGAEPLTTEAVREMLADFP
ncbi:plasmid mobilization protein [Luteolibacter soli]|uniref:Ribbon-helix-helix protein, CopG family n=1 Tax=Luteolibacter soli TaxID=3135280 RepID=A0ABU9AZB0_9BACT